MRIFHSTKVSAYRGVKGYEDGGRDFFHSGPKSDAEMIDYLRQKGYTITAPKDGTQKAKVDLVLDSLNISIDLDIPDEADREQIKSLILEDFEIQKKIFKTLEYRVQNKSGSCKVSFTSEKANKTVTYEVNAKSKKEAINLAWKKLLSSLKIKSVNYLKK